MANRHHSEILKLIKQNSGNPTQHTALDNYLGTNNQSYVEQSRLTLPAIAVRETLNKLKTGKKTVSH